ncbi:hypothetical protein PR048_021246 [Dryococelus australis]|uniref:Uncharacterized protein n=1 Tax=Dryococelus australis TaxID=614101 RepID=A0ABQ9GXP2_9NEOP|nr:hypothetical protein PR048_021246 [Dryococelus australis]
MQRRRKRDIPEKTLQRYSLHMRKSGSDPAGDRDWFTLGGGGHSSHYNNHVALGIVGYFHTMQSSDGVDWFTLGGGGHSSHYNNRVALGIVGYFHTMQSSDGVDWFTLGGGGHSSHYNNRVALGIVGYFHTMQSSDGVDWFTLGGGGHSSHYNNRVALGIVGYFHTMQSSDGVDWFTLGGGGHSSHYNNHVALGIVGYFHTMQSSDGVDWFTLGGGGHSSHYNNRVALGIVGYFHTMQSSDGVDWLTLGGGGHSSHYNNHVALGIVGYFHTMQSSDGVDWLTLGGGGHSSHYNNHVALGIVGYFHTMQSSDGTLLVACVLQRYASTRFQRTGLATLQDVARDGELGLPFSDYQQVRRKGETAIRGRAKDRREKAAGKECRLRIGANHVIRIRQGPSSRVMRLLAERGGGVEKTVTTLRLAALHGALRHKLHHSTARRSIRASDWWGSGKAETAPPPPTPTHLPHPCRYRSGSSSGTMNVHYSAAQLEAEPQSENYDLITRAGVECLNQVRRRPSSGRRVQCETSEDLEKSEVTVNMLLYQLTVLSQQAVFPRRPTSRRLRFHQNSESTLSSASVVSLAKTRGIYMITRNAGYPKIPQYPNEVRLKARPLRKTKRVHQPTLALNSVSGICDLLTSYTSVACDEVLQGKPELAQCCTRTALAEGTSDQSRAGRNRGYWGHLRESCEAPIKHVLRHQLRYHVQTDSACQPTCHAGQAEEWRLKSQPNVRNQVVFDTSYYRKLFKSAMDLHIFCEIVVSANTVQLHVGNTARLARRSDEVLGVRVSVARIAPSLLDLGRRVPTGVNPALKCSTTESNRSRWLDAPLLLLVLVTKMVNILNGRLLYWVDIHQNLRQFQPHWANLSYNARNRTNALSGTGCQDGCHRQAGVISHMSRLTLFRAQKWWSTLAANMATAGGREIREILREKVAFLYSKSTFLTRKRGKGEILAPGVLSPTLATVMKESGVSVQLKRVVPGGGVQSLASSAEVSRKCRPFYRPLSLPLAAEVCQMRRNRSELLSYSELIIPGGHLGIAGLCLLRTNVDQLRMSTILADSTLPTAVVGYVGLHVSPFFCSHSKATHTVIRPTFSPSAMLPATLLPLGNAACHTSPPSHGKPHQHWSYFLVCSQPSGHAPAKSPCADPRAYVCVGFILATLPTGRHHGHPSLPATIIVQMAIIGTPPTPPPAANMLDNATSKIQYSDVIRTNNDSRRRYTTCRHGPPMPLPIMCANGGRGRTRDRERALGHVKFRWSRGRGGEFTRKCVCVCGQKVAPRGQERQMRQCYTIYDRSRFLDAPPPPPVRCWLPKWSTSSAGRQLSRVDIEKLRLIPPHWANRSRKEQTTATKSKPQPQRANLLDAKMGDILLQPPYCWSVVFRSKMAVLSAVIESLLLLLLNESNATMWDRPWIMLFRTRIWRLALAANMATGGGREILREKREKLFFFCTWNRTFLTGKREKEEIRRFPCSRPDCRVITYTERNSHRFREFQLRTPAKWRQRPSKAPERCFCPISARYHCTDKVMRPIAMLILHKADEYTVFIQVDLKKGFQMCLVYRQQHVTSLVQRERSSVLSRLKLGRLSRALYGNEFAGAMPYLSSEGLATQNGHEVPSPVAALTYLRCNVRRGKHQFAESKHEQADKARLGKQPPWTPWLGARDFHVVTLPDHTYTHLTHTQSAILVMIVIVTTILDAGDQDLDPMTMNDLENKTRKNKFKGHGGSAVNLLASHQGDQGFNHRPGHSGFSHVGIVPDYAIGLRVFSGISSLPRPLIPVLLHTHLNRSHHNDVKRRNCNFEDMYRGHTRSACSKPGTEVLMRNSLFLFRSLQNCLPHLSHKYDVRLGVLAHFIHACRRKDSGGSVGDVGAGAKEADILDNTPEEVDDTVIATISSGVPEVIKEAK